MAILESEIAQPGGGDSPNIRHRFSREQYHAIAESGVLGDSRFELIEGDIVDMAPIGSVHAAFHDPLAEVLREAFGKGYAVRTQGPIVIGDDWRPSEPQPDVIVAKGSWRKYLGAHPVALDICLAVEVADSSLAIDRQVKARLYAAAKIPRFWIVNLVERRLEVYRQPSPAGYGEIAILHTGESISPLAVPTAIIPVADCLP